MDPDAIFIILLYFIVLILTIGSIIGLSGKIWKSSLSLFFKLLLIGIPVSLLVLAILNFNTVETGNVVISIFEVMIFSASILIGLNWSLNLKNRKLLQRIKLPVYLKVAIMTFLFTLLIPAVFYLTANFFERLNLMGSNG